MLLSNFIGSGEGGGVDAGRELFLRKMTSDFNLPFKYYVTTIALNLC